MKHGACLGGRTYSVGCDNGGYMTHASVKPAEIHNTKKEP